MVEKPSRTASEEMKLKLQKDAGIPHMPTDLTYECRMAMAGEGPRAYDWTDKPHRLVYDLCREIEALSAHASTRSSPSSSKDYRHDRTPSPSSR